MVSTLLDMVLVGRRRRRHYNEHKQENEQEDGPRQVRRPHSSMACLPLSILRTYRSRQERKKGGCSEHHGVHLFDFSTIESLRGFAYDGMRMVLRRCFSLVDRDENTQRSRWMKDRAGGNARESSLSELAR